ncbi:MAG: S-layer homology domain-containing protein, partial [Clostridia bacterium]|nr:S-layer homology domain-containing protein [Clostridia bacterium]
MNTVNAETDDTAGQAIDLLESFDIMKLTNETESDLLTRAQFAIYAANIMGVDEYKPNGERYYLDVPMDHWALNSINSLAKSGILSVGSDRLFNPDENITYNEASKILLCMMGYGQYCEARGGYPTGYARTAREIGLSGSTSGDEALTVGNAAILIYDALHINLMDATIYSSEGNKYEQAEDATLLSVYKNIYFKEGVVTSAGSIGLGASYVTDENEIMLDETRYYTEEIGVLQYLGRYV